jgi:hypothetical protein
MNIQPNNQTAFRAIKIIYDGTITWRLLDKGHKNQMYTMLKVSEGRVYQDINNIRREQQNANI